MTWLVLQPGWELELNASVRQISKQYFSCFQIKLPFEKLIHALRNFPEEAMDPDVLLPLAYSFKVISLSLSTYSFSFQEIYDILQCMNI